MTHRTNYAALLTNKPAVAKAASMVGCVQTRGRGKDDGSIRAMLEGIGKGEILLIPHAYQKCQLLNEVANLRDYIKANGIEIPGDIQTILEAFAMAMEHAATVSEVKS